MRVRALRTGPAAWLQALPFGAVFLCFFILPLVLVVAVSFWPTSDYELIPGFTVENYRAVFEGCS
ncbi:MAG: ABC transporter permease, partial [Rubrivivax sp.]|nr:ABC transporter permease [Rubrivivax sp.]